MTQNASTSSRTRVPIIAAVILVGLVIACLLDMPLYQHVHQHPPQWVRKDPGSLLRCGGYLPTWIIVSSAILLNDRARAGRWNFEAWRRGAMLFCAAAAAGITAEVTKLIFRRVRADDSGVWYRYRPIWDRPFASSALSLPSSHTMVAFGAAFMLCRLFPATRPIVLLLATGTAIARVASGAHFVSDVYVAAALAWVAAWAIDRAFTQIPARREAAVPKIA